jgi:hypothetical protein
MSQVPDQLGPGEQRDAHVQGEALDRPIPHGDQPLSEHDHTGAEHQAWELPPVNRADIEAEVHRRDVLRRTGTDGDALRPVRIDDQLPEYRLDKNAQELQRETTFDPAQDNAGPQSDKS